MATIIMPAEEAEEGAGRIMANARQFINAVVNRLVKFYEKQSGSFCDR